MLSILFFMKMNFFGGLLSRWRFTDSLFRARARMSSSVEAGGDLQAVADFAVYLHHHSYHFVED